MSPCCHNLALHVDHYPLNVSLQSSAGDEYLECFVQDVTDRKQTEQELRKDKQFLQHIFDGIQDGISVLDPTLTVTQVNRWIERVHHDEIPLIGKKCYAAYQKRTSPCPWCPSTRALATGKVQAEEVQVPQSDGSFWWCELSAYPLKDEDNQVTGVIEHVKDITDRKQAEEALRESERRYRELFENSRDGFVVIDTEGRFMDANQAYCDMLGYTLEELKQKTDFYEITPPCWCVWEQQEIWQKRLLQEGYSRIYEKEYIRKDGTVFPVELQSYTVFDEEGKPRYLWGIARDITERKQAEEALRESEERFRSIFENATIGIYRTTPDGRILMANPTLVQMLGYSSFEELTQRNLNQEGFEAQYPRAVFQQRIEREGKVFGLELAWGRRDGTTIFIRESARAVRDTSGKILYYEGTVEDITARKRAEEALRQSEEKYRAYVENAPVGIFITNAEGRYVEVNEAACQMTGYSRDELLRMTIPDLAPPESPPETFESFATLQETGRVEAEIIIRKQDGSDIHASLKAVALASDRYMGFCSDITERKQAEEALRRLNAQLEQRVTERTAQLEAINSELKDFAYIASHDLKAPLRGVSHLATWILQDYAEVLDDQGQELLHLLSSRVQRMARLIEGILEYSRIGRLQGEKQWLNLQTLVHDIIDSLAPPTHIQVSVETPLPNVWGNSTRIMQVFQNLISNAIEYHDKAQGSVTVRCDDAGEQWQFSVADNGPGIAQHDYDRIFKIFQTGHRRDEIESTGIGLTVVKKIVELYGGAIWVQSEVGVGSTFCFTLPRHGEQPESKR